MHLKVVEADDGVVVGKCSLFFIEFVYPRVDDLARAFVALTEVSES